MRFIYTLFIIFLTISLSFSKIMYLSGGISAEIIYGQITYTSTGNINFYKYFIRGRQNATNIIISNLINTSNKITLVLTYNGTIKDVESNKNLDVVIGHKKVVIHFQIDVNEKLTLLLIGTNRIEKIGSYSGFLPAKRFIKTEEKPQYENNVINQFLEQNTSKIEETKNETRIIKKNISSSEPLVLNYKEKKEVNIVNILFFIIIVGLTLILAKYVLGIIKEGKPLKKEESTLYSTEDDVYLERFFEE